MFHTRPMFHTMSHSRQGTRQLNEFSDAQRGSTKALLGRSGFEACAFKQHLWHKLGAPSSFLLLVVWPGAPSSILAPSSDARSP